MPAQRPGNGRWLAESGFGTPQRPVAMIAAGERYPDGSLRPALEDLFGAGAIVGGLLRQSGVLPSPEAAAAAACLQGTSDLRASVATSVSGRELSERGFESDVDIATELDSSQLVTVLTGGVFIAS